MPTAAFTDLSQIPDAAIGSAAGIATSVLWTGTSLLFTAAAKRLGALVVNTARICMAVVLLGITHRLLTGDWLPDVNSRQVLYLGLSGLVGLAIGDQALFTAFVDIGPRLAMLVMTSAPLFAALFGWAQLGEKPAPLDWLGIAITLIGIAWVIAERPRMVGQPPGVTGMMPTRRGRGLTLAFIGAACQAGGFLLSKVGMGHGWLPRAEHVDPQTASLVRMFFAALCMTPILLLHGVRGRTRQAGMARRAHSNVAAALLFTLGGATVGPFLGMWMSLVAGDHIPLGVAQTLLSLPPVFILPFAYWIHKEHIGFRAVAGAVLAVAGVAILCLPKLWPAA
jgi:drug/metabolite transporter (DMT)-like permease